MNESKKVIHTGPWNLKPNLRESYRDRAIEKERLCSLYLEGVMEISG